MFYGDSPTSSTQRKAEFSCTETFSYYSVRLPSSRCVPASSSSASPHRAPGAQYGKEGPAGATLPGTRVTLRAVVRRQQKLLQQRIRQKITKSATRMGAAATPSKRGPDRDSLHTAHRRRCPALPQPIAALPRPHGAPRPRSSFPPPFTANDLIGDAALLPALPISR